MFCILTGVTVTIGVHILRIYILYMYLSHCHKTFRYKMHLANAKSPPVMGTLSGAGPGSEVLQVAEKTLMHR